MSNRLTASDFVTLFRPSKCGNRVYLHETVGEAGSPSPYEQVLFRMGRNHEARHLATFPDYVDLSQGSYEEREERTKECLRDGVPVIYHGL